MRASYTGVREERRSWSDVIPREGAEPRTARLNRVLEWSELGGWPRVP